MAKQKHKDVDKLSTAERAILLVSWAIMAPSMFLFQFLFIVPPIYFVIILGGLALQTGMFKTDAAKRPVLFFTVAGALSAIWLLWAYQDIFQY